MLTRKFNMKRITAKEGLDSSEELDCYGMFAKKIKGATTPREDTVVCAARMRAESCSACCRFLPTTPASPSEISRWTFLFRLCPSQQKIMF